MAGTQREQGFACGGPWTSWTAEGTSGDARRSSQKRRWSYRACQQRCARGAHPGDEPWPPATTPTIN